MEYKIIYVLRLTQLYNIVLLFCYWLLVLASMDHHQANIYKNLNLPVHTVQQRQCLWDPF